DVVVEEKEIPAARLLRAAISRRRLPGVVLDHRLHRERQLERADQLLAYGVRAVEDDDQLQPLGRRHLRGQRLEARAQPPRAVAGRDDDAELDRSWRPGGHGSHRSREVRRRPVGPFVYWSALVT